VNGIKRGDVGVGKGSVEKRGGDGESVPVLQAAKVEAVGLHAQHALGDQLAGGFDKRPQDRAVQPGGRESAVEEFSEEVVMLCRNPDCGKELKARNGFWYCPDVTGCSLGGKQQGRV